WLAFTNHLSISSNGQPYNCIAADCPIKVFLTRVLPAMVVEIWGAYAVKVSTESKLSLFSNLGL
ncbi:MAG: hypothetical protein R3264_14410, partial [Anaerolineae bacterium]|nr:hypothetical protein [Anaerolineae bacterium]